MEDIAKYSFLVQVASDDYVLLNSFGYKEEEKFRERVTRNIMKAIAGMSNIKSINIFPIYEAGAEEYLEDFANEDSGDN